MNRKQTVLGLALLALALAFSLQPSALVSASPLGTAFTYHGWLNDAGSPANGTYDLKFTLCDADTGGGTVAGPLTNSAVALSHGLFTAVLDFGPGVFNGEARWLEIGVRTNGASSDFTLLSPRQSVAASPYAIYAPSAGTAGTATSAASAASAGSFSGSLAGDVTGTQGATVVASVGGQTAVNVAGGASAANGATSADTPNTIVKRDGSGGFTAGIITGNGSGLTNIGTSSLAAGAVTATQLASGAAAANLNASGQSTVPGGGMILSSNYNDANLVGAGYVRLGKVRLNDLWEQRAGGAWIGRRTAHTAVWTGSEMIVWGGSADSGPLNDGSRYNPVANNWTAVNTSSAPAARSAHTAVWTGSEMIVWGGAGNGTT